MKDFCMKTIKLNKIFACTLLLLVVQLALPARVMAAAAGNPQLARIEDELLDGVEGINLGSACVVKQHSIQFDSMKSMLDQKLWHLNRIYTAVKKHIVYTITCPKDVYSAYRVFALSRLPNSPKTPQQIQQAFANISSWSKAAVRGDRQCQEFFQNIIVASIPSELRKKLSLFSRDARCQDLLSIIQEMFTVLDLCALHQIALNKGIIQGFDEDERYELCNQANELINGLVARISAIIHVGKTTEGKFTFLLSQPEQLEVERYVGAMVDSLHVKVNELFNIQCDADFGHMSPCSSVRPSISTPLILAGISGGGGSPILLQKKI